MNIQELAHKLALARVNAEDEAARARRIDQYATELVRVLEDIEEAKKLGKKSIAIAYDHFKHDEMGRICESLQTLGYEIPKSEVKQGEWTNGVGYATYREQRILWK